MESRTHAGTALHARHSTSAQPRQAHGETSEHSHGPAGLCVRCRASVLGPAPPAESAPRISTGQRTADARKLAGGATRPERFRLVSLGTDETTCGARDTAGHAHTREHHNAPNQYLIKHWQCDAETRRKEVALDNLGCAQRLACVWLVLQSAAAPHRSVSAPDMPEIAARTCTCLAQDRSGAHPSPNNGAAYLPAGLLLRNVV
eukprot:2280924-Rhodomonas_salina.5